MKAFLFILSGIILLISNVGLLRAESDKPVAEGFLKAGPKVMNINDMVSIWSANQRTLKLFFFLFSQRYSWDIKCRSKVYIQ
jgi:hypothetical protein